MQPNRIINKTYIAKQSDELAKLIPAYIADDSLIEAVNIAAFLGRPLFITGDPGCGKTRLAEAIAAEWYLDKYKEFYFRWDIKSTTKAREGLYSFDNLKRLFDVQSSATNQTVLHGKSFARRGIKDLANYRSFGKLGEAFRKSTAENPAILLIDEIDKAPIDFPNDLLLELDEMKFFIPETNETIVAQQRPLLIITSNSEKEMPAAFLRRCVYHKIQFPTDQRLKEILETNKDVDTTLFEDGITVFRAIREVQEKNQQSGEKLVSTSEMIDWFLYMSSATPERKEQIKEQLEKGKIPAVQALFKKREDAKLFPNNSVEIPKKEPKQLSYGKE